MRRTVLAFMAVTALAAGCSPPAETSRTAAPAAAGAETGPPEMPADAPPQEEVDPALVTAPLGATSSCLDQIGAVAAQRLVQRCIAVSPATRPPCNVANTCAMIEDEIERSCGMYAPGEARPAECAA
jgi:hypothetical protein